MTFDYSSSQSRRLHFPSHLLQTSKIVPTAALFGAKPVGGGGGSHYLLTLESLGHELRSQLGWLPLGVRAYRASIGDLAQGPGPHN